MPPCVLGSMCSGKEQNPFRLVWKSLQFSRYCDILLAPLSDTEVILKSSPQKLLYKVHDNTTWVLIVKRIFNGENKKRTKLSKTES